MERKYFGTDGIRGVANVPPLNSETLVRLGKAIAKVFVAKRGHHKILVGKDTRLSGYMIESSLCAGIMSMGADVLLVGPIPTPGAAYLTRSMRADAGVMISASHNPFEDNGIKIFGSDGFKLPDEIELQIEALLESEALDGTGSEPGAIGKATRIDDALGRYLVSLKSAFPREFTLEGFKVGVDCANGAAYQVAPLALSELGADVVSRGISPNGRNINAGFGSLFPEVVSELVREQNLHIGIALDGDADRAILVDEKGRVLDGDVTLSIIALDLLERGQLPVKKIVATVMSNLGLESLLNAHGIEVLRAPVGDRYVLEEMIQHGALLGGEQSGHTIFLEQATTGDGTLTALMVLSAMCRTGKKLSELADRFKKFPQKLINIKVSEKPPLESIQALQEIIGVKEKELGSTGRILVRYSGTENKARVMVECADEVDCDKHASEIAEVLEKAIGG